MAMEPQAEHQAEVVVEEAVIRVIHLEELEPEESVVYGPGDSKYSRAIWHSCPEA